MPAHALTIGRIVHHRMPSGAWRPAIVVQVWNPTTVNLQVFTDGLNDPALDNRRGHNVQWATSARPLSVVGADPDRAAWRWPDEATAP